MLIMDIGKARWPEIQDAHGKLSIIKARKYNFLAFS